MAPLSGCEGTSAMSEGMVNVASISSQSDQSLGQRIRRAVLWRSGSQLVAQLVQWAATFLVIRILDPHDYGLFAMTQVILVLLNMLNGYGLASGLIQQKDISDREVRQLFGIAGRIASTVVQ